MLLIIFAYSDLIKLSLHQDSLLYAIDLIENLLQSSKKGGIFIAIGTLKEYPQAPADAGQRIENQGNKQWRSSTKS